MAAPSAPIEQQPLPNQPPPAPGYYMPPPQGMGQGHPAGGQGQWMQPQQAPIGCPPGLEYLAAVDQLLVKQKVELLEAFTGFETGNKYEVLNSMGQPIFYAAEDSCCCGLCFCCDPCRCCRKCQKQCCRNRAFTLSLYDNLKNKIATFSRPLRCATCWCPCCLQKLEVTAPPGTVIGYVKQKWSLCHPEYAICDESGKKVLSIEGPICTWSCCGDVKFKVLGSDGREVGMVSKQWSGFAQEYFTDADNFGLSFPMDLDVKCKATILGACFLIDFMFFEDTGGKKNKDAPGMAG